MENELAPEELQQLKTFSRLAKDYVSHYEDSYSRIYRDRFLYDPLFEGFDLGGKQVLEAMCGPGSATKYLLDRGARVTGLDISDDFLKIFSERWPGCQTICASARVIPVPSDTFDSVVIIGGLHHTHPAVSDVIREIHRVLRPGGSFFFIEPHAGSFVDRLRKLWYRLDPLFAANEASIDLRELTKTHSSKFAPTKTKYAGGPAYFLVLQSMIFRVPVALKPLYSPFLMKIDQALLSWQESRPAVGAVAICEWRKI